MKTQADNRQKQAIGDIFGESDEAGFRDMFDDA